MRFSYGSTFPTEHVHCYIVSQRVFNTNPHRSFPTQQDCQAFWLGLVAQVWWFQIKQA